MPAVWILIIAGLFFSGVPLRSQNGSPGSKAFNRYWRQGKAELNRFRLTQSRYGEPRNGNAVLVFVVEDFLKGKQVKYEGKKRTEVDAIPILKMNQLRRFQTGVYDYSMMLSLFSPLDLTKWPLSLKATASIQDWCGQAWHQINLKEKGYQVQLHSYFQKEADKKTRVSKAFLLDEVWTRIRLNPKSLPEGEFQVLPSLFQTRLLHLPFQPVKAVGRRTVLFDGMSSYEVKIPSATRSLKVFFETNFPRRIDSFIERWKGKDGKVHETKGVRTHLLMLDYWAKHAKKDNALRAHLGLPLAPREVPNGASKRKGK
jgi:hypothetical protein